MIFFYIGILIKKIHTRLGENLQFANVHIRDSGLYFMQFNQIINCNERTNISYILPNMKKNDKQVQ